MVKNQTGKTEFLRSLIIGKPAVWYCDSTLCDPDMRNFTAIITMRMKGVKIKQKKALLVVEGVIPQSVIIIERIE